MAAKSTLPTPTAPLRVKSSSRYLEQGFAHAYAEAAIGRDRAGRFTDAHDSPCRLNPRPGWGSHACNITAGRLAQVTIINYVNDEDRINFDCAVTSQNARNIAADDRISLALVVPYPASDPIYGLWLTGRATLVEMPAELSHIIDLWKIRYST